MTPRSASRSSTSRKLRVNRWYNQTAWLMISGGKRWRRYRDSIGQLSPTAVNLTMPCAVLLALVGRRTSEPTVVRQHAGEDLGATCAGRLKRPTRSGRTGELPKGNVGAVWSRGPRASPNATIAPCLTPRAGVKGGLNATGRRKTVAWQHRVGYPIPCRDSQNGNPRLRENHDGCFCLVLYRG